MAQFKRFRDLHKIFQDFLLQLSRWLILNLFSSVHQQQPNRKSLCFEDVQYRGNCKKNPNTEMNKFLTNFYSKSGQSNQPPHQHNVSDKDKRYSNRQSNLPYTTLPRNINLQQKTATLKLVPFTPLSESNEDQAVNHTIETKNRNPFILNRPSNNCRTWMGSHMLNLTCLEVEEVPFQAYQCLH